MMNPPQCPIQKPRISIKNGYKHRRNPSIGTLINSKRYQQTTPKHYDDQMDHHHHHHQSSFFPPNTNESDLHKIINRLRIENSHVMKKYDDLSKQNAILHKGIKQSKHRCTMLEAQTQKLKKNNKSLQKQLNEQMTEGDTISSISFKSHIQSLEDSHKKEVLKYAKVYSFRPVFLYIFCVNCNTTNRLKSHWKIL